MAPTPHAEELRRDVLVASAAKSLERRPDRPKPAPVLALRGFMGHQFAIKARLGKIEADPHELTAAIEASGFLELPVSAGHAAGVAKLELHHNDPFDRLLIAQALAEPLKLVTVDEVLAKYSDVVVLV